MTAGTTHETVSPADTEALGAALAASLQAGDVVLLYGEMGAGKTTFVRGAVRALGHVGPVTSPTYTIARRYPDARLPVAHLDLHRLTSLDDEDPALLTDHMGLDGVAFVEWPQVADDDRFVRDAGVRIAARVYLDHVAPERRSVRILT